MVVNEGGYVPRRIPNTDTLGITHRKDGELNILAIPSTGDPVVQSVISLETFTAISSHVLQNLTTHLEVLLHGKSWDMSFLSLKSLNPSSHRQMLREKYNVKYNAAES